MSKYGSHEKPKEGSRGEGREKMSKVENEWARERGERMMYILYKEFYIKKKLTQFMIVTSGIVLCFFFSVVFIIYSEKSLLDHYD